jgi:hypothetical protein
MFQQLAVYELVIAYFCGLNIPLYSYTPFLRRNGPGLAKAENRANFRLSGWSQYQALTLSWNGHSTLLPCSKSLYWCTHDFSRAQCMRSETNQNCIGFWVQILDEPKELLHTPTGTNVIKLLG